MKYLSLILASAIGLGPVLVGCDDNTVEHKRDVEVKDNGTVVDKEKTVKQKSDGTVVKEEKTDVVMVYDRANPSK